jgi:hypothetical protein
MDAMSTEPEEDPTPDQLRSADLFFAAIMEPDDRKARELIERSSEALVAGIQARVREKCDAANALLAAAEVALDASEASKDPAESARQRQLCELYLASATTIKRELSGA